MKSEINDVDLSPILSYSEVSDGFIVGLSFEFKNISQTEDGVNIGIQN